MAVKLYRPLTCAFRPWFIGMGASASLNHRGGLSLPRFGGGMHEAAGAHFGRVAALRRKARPVGTARFWLDIPHDFPIHNHFAEVVYMRTKKRKTRSQPARKDFRRFYPSASCGDCAYCARLLSGICYCQKQRAVVDPRQRACYYYRPGRQRA